MKLTDFRGHELAEGDHINVVINGGLRDASIIQTNTGISLDPNSPQAQPSIVIAVVLPMPVAPNGFVPGVSKAAIPPAPLDGQ